MFRLFKGPYSGGVYVNQLQLTNFAYTLTGEGVEYDMLLEYLLYLTAQQDPKASTSVWLPFN